MLLNYLRVSDLSAADLDLLLDLAAAIERDPCRDDTMLEDEVVGLYFAKPSTRTRISFAVAIRRLGGIPEPLGPHDLQLERGETIEDTALMVSLYLRAFVIRTFAQERVERFASAASIPVINALTDTHDPCQALADLLVLREQFGSLRGLRIAYVGDGNNVTHSLMEAGALAGMHVVIATPNDRGPDPCDRARRNNDGSGIRRLDHGHARSPRRRCRRRRRVHGRLALDGRRRRRTRQRVPPPWHRSR